MRIRCKLRPCAQLQAQIVRNKKGCFWQHYDEFQLVLTTKTLSKLVWSSWVQFVFSLEPTLFTIVFLSKLRKRRNCSCWRAWVTNCLFVDIWCDYSIFGLFHFCLNNIVDVESIGARGLNATNGIYSCIDRYVLLIRLWYSKNMKQNMLPSRVETLYTWLWEVVTPGRKNNAGKSVLSVYAIKWLNCWTTTPWAISDPDRAQMQTQLLPAAPTPSAAAKVQGMMESNSGKNSANHR